ncbi:hypothetical protein KM043_009662 [Ampulex compressa]|nr:hypothetical protein KM043_009662 [Ampulex compressa]
MSERAGESYEEEEKGSEQVSEAIFSVHLAGADRTGCTLAWQKLPKTRRIGRRDSRRRARKEGEGRALFLVGLDSARAKRGIEHRFRENGRAGKKGAAGDRDGRGKKLKIVRRPKAQDDLGAGIGIERDFTRGNDSRRVGLRRRPTLKDFNPRLMNPRS